MKCTHYSCLFAAILILLSLSAKGQTVTRLYAIGTAVPGGVQELTVFPNNQFKFAGALQEGTLMLATSNNTSVSSTQYLKPSYEDAYIVNNGMTYTTTRDSTNAKWIVPFSEERFRFTVNTTARTVKGELFVPWNELFVMGGATECAWTTYTFLPFTRLEDEICTWEWTGELKYRPENNEPRHFKFSGQNAWEPKMLHPFKADENVLESKQLLTNGAGDNKWSVINDGFYHIVIDVFRETIKAEYLGVQAINDGEMSVENMKENAITIRQNGKLLEIVSGEVVSVDVTNAQGHTIYHNIKAQHRISLPNRGLYVIKAGNLSRKILVV